MKSLIELIRHMSQTLHRLEFHGLLRARINLGLHVALIIAFTVGLCALVIAQDATDAIRSCGNFNFQGSSGLDEAHIDNKFSLVPSSCQSACECSTICYIQIVRVTDLSTGEPLTTSQEQWDRMVTGQNDASLNYWFVDRLDNQIWGYYGRNNDDTFNGWLLRPGNNREPAELWDDPYPCRETYETHPVKFEGIDVTVCIDDKSDCVYKLLGCYYYCFTVHKEDAAGDLSSHVAAAWNKKVVELAVQKWTMKAAELEKRRFPPFKWLAQ